MANWITHMMIADFVYEHVNGLDRTGFCIGNIAPDCNIENEDWSAFTPSRAVTHWMGGDRKDEDDCERFFRECIAGKSFYGEEERSFYLGYYAHLVTDAYFQKFARDETRVRNMLARIRKHPEMSQKIKEYSDGFDAVKRAFEKRERMRDVAQIEYEYIQKNPQSAYMTVLRTTKAFPEYFNFFPKGAIVRKLGVMAVLPEVVEDAQFVFFTRNEYEGFVDRVCTAVIDKIAGLNCEEESKCVF